MAGSGFSPGASENARRSVAVASEPVEAGEARLEPLALLGELALEPRDRAASDSATRSRARPRCATSASATRRSWSSSSAASRSSSPSRPAASSVCASSRARELRDLAADPLELGFAERDFAGRIVRLRRDEGDARDERDRERDGERCDPRDAHEVQGAAAAAPSRLRPSSFVGGWTP